MPKSQYFDGAVYETAKAVRQKVEAQRLKLNEGTEYARANDASVGALLDRYIAEEMPARHVTKGRYTSINNTHLRPNWGGCLISEIRPAQIHAWPATVLWLQISEGFFSGTLVDLNPIPEKL